MNQEPTVSYAIGPRRDGWELGERTMPESFLHREIVDLLKAILVAWVARAERDLQIVCNLAVRWERLSPSIGVDPDVALIKRPPEGDALRSLRTWTHGHAPPLLAIEVVSETDPSKDYVIAPEKYAASGTEELWIFDPLLAGPKSHNGPYVLQVWRRDEGGAFKREYAGAGPVYSAAVDAWVMFSEEATRLRIADGPDGSGLWLTLAEVERQEKEAERAAKEVERAAKENALARIAELEAELRSRK